MKPRLLLLVLASIVSRAQAAPETCLLARDGKAALPILISPRASATTREAAGDLAAALGKVTGATYSIVESEEAADGILVGSLAEFPTPNLQKALDAFPEPRSRERFVLRSESERLWVVAADDLGVPHAVYTLLDRIGCRWILPSENWTIFPEKKTLELAIDETMSPAFRLRQFFGTGGFGPANPVDPKLTLPKRWELWKRRNRFGGEFQFAGHTGEAFNVAAKAELMAHPDYLPMIDGKRQPWSPAGKFCVSNPGALALFTDFRLRSLRAAVKANPKAPGSYAVSVEPADGGGHCECPKCLAIGGGSVSDRVFYVANHVARAMREEFPGRYASLYAYNEHAAVPDIPVEPNVYVILIPYGFQRTGMSGDDLIAAWSQKIDRMSLYDYWAIPDWENNLPTFDYVTHPARRIRQWRASGIEGMSNESVWGAGSMGLGWYVSSRLLWNPKTDERALIEELYSLAFGPAAEPMRRMLERWNAGFLLNSHELGLSHRDLAQARRLAAGNEAVLARLDDYTAYLRYISLWFEYQEAKPGTPERSAAAREVVTHVWRCYHDTMVASFRMYQLVALRYEKDQALAADFDPVKPDAPGWKTIRPFTRGELETDLAAGLEKYRPLDFERRRFTGPLVPLEPGRAPDGTFYKGISIGSTASFEFEALPGMTEMPLRINVRHKPKAMPDRLTVTGPDGARIFEIALPATGEWQDISIPLRKPGRHRLEIFDQKTMFRIELPAGVPHSLGEFTSPDLSTRLYFYVPKGTRRLAIAAPGVIPIKLFDAEGHAVTYQGDKLIVAEVPTGQDGRAWSFSGYKSYTPIRFLNAPQSFAFSADTLMIPEDAR